MANQNPLASKSESRSTPMANQPRELASCEARADQLEVEIDEQADAAVAASRALVATLRAQAANASTLEPERVSASPARDERPFLIARIVWLAAPLGVKDLARVVAFAEGLGAK